jgi:putative nucleotidyltransferase with HDIG domain
MICVSQLCALIALKRNEDVELATMAGLLHDIHLLINLDSEKHAVKGAVLAREILEELELTTEKETNKICSAINNHSKKRKTFTSFDEVLIDADVFEHALYNMTIPLREKDMERFLRLSNEFLNSTNNTK